MKTLQALRHATRIAAVVWLALGFPAAASAADAPPMVVRCAVTNDPGKETVVFLKVGEAAMKAREEGKPVVVFFSGERAFPEDQKSDSKTLGLEYVGRSAKDGFAELIAQEPIYDAVRNAVVVYAPMGEDQNIPDMALLRLQDACGLTDTYPAVAVLKIYPEATAENVLAARKTYTGAWTDPAAMATEIRQLIETPFPEASEENDGSAPAPQPSGEQQPAMPTPAPTTVPEQTPAATPEPVSPKPSVEPAVSPAPERPASGQPAIPLWGVVLGVVVVALVGWLVWTIRAATAKTQPSASVPAAAPASRNEAAAYIEVLPPFSGRHEMTRDILHLGRGKDNEVVLDEKSVSKHHAVIQRKRHDEFSITDLDSGNGTLVNGKEVQSSPLADGDVIELGEVKIRFWLPKRR